MRVFRSLRGRLVAAAIACGGLAVAAEAWRWATCAEYRSASSEHLPPGGAVSIAGDEPVTPESPEARKSVRDSHAPRVPAQDFGSTSDLSANSSAGGGSNSRVESLVIGGYLDGWPYLGVEDGEADGLCVRITREAFSRAGIEVKFKMLPFKRLLHEGRAGRIGIVGVYFNRERAEEFDFTDPLCRSVLRAFAGPEVLRGVGSLRDLRGLTVAVARGPSYGPDVDAALASDGVEVVRVNGFDSVLRVLLAGRVDLAFDNSTRGELFFNDVGDSGAIAMSEWVASDNNMHLAFPKSMRATTYVDAFNRSLLEMKADGTYVAIVSQFSLQDVLGDIMPADDAEQNASSRS